MIDLYLRAASEAEARAALPQFIDAETGEWIAASHGFAMACIGEIDGVAGWHINLRLLDAALLDAVQASGLVIAPPATPAMVWAGAEAQPSEAPEGGEG